MVGGALREPQAFVTNGVHYFSYQMCDKLSHGALYVRTCSRGEEVFRSFHEMGLGRVF